MSSTEESLDRMLSHTRPFSACSILPLSSLRQQANTSLPAWPIWWASCRATHPSRLAVSWENSEALSSTLSVHLVWLATVVTIAAGRGGVVLKMATSTCAAVSFFCTTSVWVACDSWRPLSLIFWHSGICRAVSIPSFGLSVCVPLDTVHVLGAFWSVGSHSGCLLVSFCLAMCLVAQWAVCTLLSNWESSSWGGWESLWTFADGGALQPCIFWWSGFPSLSSDLLVRSKLLSAIMINLDKWVTFNNNAPQ